MKQLKILYILFILTSVLCGCGIANYTKANQLKSEILSEKQKTTGLDKKIFSEQRKLQKLKDSIHRYNALLGEGKHGK